MSKKRKAHNAESAAPASVSSPITAAMQATMPIVYSAQIAHTQKLSGPVPSPEILAQYEKLLTGSANRIFCLAEQEAAHRRQMEKDVLVLQKADQRSYRASELLGQIFGLAIGLASIGGAVTVALHGAEIAASFIGTAGVTGLVTSFILGRSFLIKQKQQEFEQIQKANDQRSAELSRAAKST